MFQSGSSRMIRPGRVILYRGSRADLPLWPAIYLTDEATPKSFLDTRPHGFYSVVLKLTVVLDSSQLRWAQVSQMIPFDPSAASESIKRSTPGLQSAYRLALEAEESEYDLDYWKVMLASTQDTGVLGSLDSDDEDWTNDPEMLEAIQLSLLDNAPQRLQRQPNYTAIQSSPSNSRIELSVPSSRRFRPHLANSKLSLPVRKHSTEPALFTPAPSPTSKHSFEYPSVLSKRSSPPSPTRSDDRSPTLSQERKLIGRRNELNTPAPAVSDGDVVEENLDESGQFVQVFVGPEMDPASNSDVDPERRRFRLQLLKHSVWDRRYFRDAVSARNYFEPIGENTWELIHPRLIDILPADFRWAAEFLSDGDFGHRDPDDEDQVAETFAQCISAWKTAEILSMDDLMEHIVQKIRAAQPWWDLWNVMAFACSIYQSEVTLQAHNDLKALFSEYIAELYFIYLEDDHLSGTFLTRLKQLPELERDVLVKRIARLGAHQQLQHDRGLVLPEADVGMGDDMGDDMDLYT